MLNVGTEILLYSGRYEVGGEDRKRHAYSTIFVQGAVGGPVAATITKSENSEYEVRTHGSGWTLQRVKPHDIMGVLEKGD